MLTTKTVSGEKRTADSRPIYLYAGRSDDIRRRLNEHFTREIQDIDLYIQVLLEC